MYEYVLFYAALERKRKIMLAVGCVLLVALIAGLSVLIYRTCYQPVIEKQRFLWPAHKDVSYKEWRYTIYFAKRGSRVPGLMAKACLNTKRPRIIAAIASVETNGNPHIRRAGYKRRHHGAWCVNPKYWGPVSHSALKQALQAEDVLEDFVRMSKGDIKKALSGYGGDSTTKYANKVLAELQEVP